MDETTTPENNIPSPEPLAESPASTAPLSKDQQRRAAEEKKTRERIKRETEGMGGPVRGRKRGGGKGVKKPAKGTKALGGKKGLEALLSKGNIKLMSFLAFAGFVGYIVWMGMQPRIGTMAYGICRVFLERYVQFPTTLRIAEVTEFSTSVRIWFVHNDSFGQFRMEPIQCYYKPDPQQGYILEKISLRRKDLPQEEVDAFNKVLPVVRSSGPDLRIPPRLTSNLEKMRANLYKLP